VEVRPGYKRTEVGVIPDDWKVERIADIAEIFGGGTPSTTVAEYWDGQIPWVSAGDVSRSSGRYVNDTADRISELGLASCSARMMPTGTTIIIARGATVGRMAQLGSPMAFNQTCYGLLPVSGTDQDYLYYAMLFSVNSMRTLTYGTIFGTITTNSFGQWQIPLPSFPEQQAIAEALSDVDAFIATLDRLIAKKRAIKQGAMQQLLTGQTRLPGFSGRTGYKQTKVGMIPKDWEAKRIGELFEVTSSKRVFQSEWKTKGVPFYRARELAVLGEQGFVENELFISREMYDAYKNTYGVPKVGDILVTGVGTLGKVYVVSDDHEFYFKDGNIIWFKSSGRASSDYVRQLYLTQLVIRQIENASAGTTVGTYTISGAKETIIPFPPLPEQRVIAAVLSDMDAEIAALEARREKTRALKLGMMQELLTGKTRLV
jgi:type I restriction enzyme S subunit